MKIALFLIIIVVAMVIAHYLYWNNNPKNIGIHDGHLSSCPNSPNCVSSQATDPAHHVKPFTVPLSIIKIVIQQMPEATIITDNDNYLHVEFRSKRLRFVDDVEFLDDPKNGVVHVRSASRVGYSDLGVNRARIERLQALSQ